MMNGSNISLVHLLGPWVQLFFFLGLLFMVGILLGAVAFWGERRLVRTQKCVLWIFPFPTLFIFLFYGVLRFSGLLLYSTDGWDTSGTWNYTNQNQGISVIFLCLCLLIGAALAVHKDRRQA